MVLIDNFIVFGFSSLLTLLFLIFFLVLFGFLLLFVVALSEVLLFLIALWILLDYMWYIDWYVLVVVRSCCVDLMILRMLLVLMILMAWIV